jgi:flagellar biosynthesis/type III secretory pathway M-ring protein FliF/YscJ
MIAEQTAAWMERLEQLTGWGVMGIVLLIIVRWMLTRFEKRMDAHSAGLRAVEKQLAALLTCLRDQQTENFRMQRELIQTLLGGRHEQTNPAGAGGARPGAGDV